MNKPTVYAEDCNYWKTSRASADEWIDKAKREIKAIKGKILGDAFGSEAATGRAAYMIMFELEGESFKFTWPVLVSKTSNEKAARVQAATALYHSVKSRCIEAKTLGGRNAFFNALMLPNGQAIAELHPDDLVQLPRMFSGPLLMSGEIIDG